MLPPYIPGLDLPGKCTATCLGIVPRNTGRWAIWIGATERVSILVGVVDTAVGRTDGGPNDRVNLPVGIATVPFWNIAARLLDRVLY